MIVIVARERQKFRRERRGVAEDREHQRLLVALERLDDALDVFDRLLGPADRDRDHQRCRCAGSSSSALAPRPTRSGSQIGCVVRSSGLCGVMNAGSRFFSASDAFRRHRRHVEADRLAEVVRDRAERAGESQDADALGRRLRIARQDFRRVGEFVERFDQRNAGMRDLRAHHLVVAGERAGMRLRRLLRRLCRGPGASG